MWISLGPLAETKYRQPAANVTEATEMAEPLVWVMRISVATPEKV